MITGSVTAPLLVLHVFDLAKFIDNADIAARVGSFTMRGIVTAVIVLGSVFPAQLASRDRAEAQPERYQTSQGQTMIVVRGPVSAIMGSPPAERGRQPASDSAAEPQHTVNIRRSFAISATEITNAQFRRFLEANPEAQRRYAYYGAPERMAEVLQQFSPDADSPAIAVTWYEAAMYCNWLSAQEGLPASQWVYPAGTLRDGMHMPADYLQRVGYRLPTEPEWEFAARAGTMTARFFGDTDVRLGDYAWFARHPPRSRKDPVDPTDPQRAARVGLLKPNPLGLLDVYGNVWEWTQDRVSRFQTAEVTDDREDPVLIVTDKDARTRRGGAFPYGAAFARSAARGTVNSLPTQRRDNVGFRIAKTIAPTTP